MILNSRGVLDEKVVVPAIPLSGRRQCLQMINTSSVRKYVIFCEHMIFFFFFFHFSLPSYVISEVLERNLRCLCGQRD